MDNNNNNDFESLIAADVSLGGGVWAVLLCVLATVACGGWIVSLLMREGAAATTTTATSSTTSTITTTTATAEGEERDADEGAVAPPHVHGMLAMVCVCSVFTCMAQLSLVPDLPTAYSFSGVSRHPHDSYYSYFRQRQQSQQRASPAAFRQTQQQHFAAASKNNDVSAPSYLLVGVRKLTVTPAFEPREKGRNNKNKNKNNNNGHNDQNNDNNNDSSGLARHRRGARGLLLFHHHNNTGARSTLQARRPQDERLS